MGGGKDSVGGYDYNLELASPGTKNDSSVAEKGTIKALDTPTYFSVQQFAFPGHWKNVTGDTAIKKGLHIGLTAEQAEELSVGIPKSGMSGISNSQWDGKEAEMGGGNESVSGNDYNIELPSPGGGMGVHVRPAPTDIRVNLRILPGACRVCYGEPRHIDGCDYYCAPWPYEQCAVSKIFFNCSVTFSASSWGLH